MGKRTILNGIINRIYLVGVELEGGWMKRPPDEDIIRDGSVEFVPPPAEYETVAQGYDASGTMKYAKVRKPSTWVHPEYVGEIVGRPMVPGSEDLHEWMRRCYPTMVNATCGLHVHMSFHHKLNYQRLMTPEYMAAILDGLKEWGEAEGIPKDHSFWPRILQPDHRHCSHQYLGDNQVKISRKDYHSRGTVYSRYTAINYCFSMRDGGKPRETVECRLLPMFDKAEQGISAIDAVINITNKFLSRIRQRERRSTVAVPKREEVIVEYPTIVR